MATYIKGLADKDGNTINPRTSIEAVAGLEEALAQAGTVKDVELDGTSILDEQGVANIDINADTLVHTTDAAPSTPTPLTNADTLDGHDSTYFATKVEDGQKVSYTSAQSLTNAQKEQARNNIGITNESVVVTGAVSSVNGSTGTVTLDGNNLYIDRSVASPVKIKDKLEDLDEDKANQTSVATEWVGGTSYTVGAYVTYEGNLYKCKTDTSAASWDSTAWNSISIGEEVNDLKSAINKLGVNDNVYVQPEWEQGDLSISNYALDYSDTQTNVCRMVEGSPAVFLNGTVIRVKDPVYLFSYYYSGTSGQWYAQDNKTELTINASSGNYRMTFSVRRKDWHDITAEEAANAIEIILPFNPYNMRNEEYYKLFSLSDALITNGILWDVGNGVNDASTSAKVSSFIPVSNGQTIKYDLSAGGNGRYVICIYDTGFKFVSGVENTGAGTVTITADGYIRICCLNDYAGYVFFDYPIPDKIQVELDKINRTIVDDVTGTDYMQTALTRITGELKEKSVLGNIVTIGFSTDQHIKDDSDATATAPVLRGLSVLSKLTQAYPYDFVCLGGDACEEGAYATTIERILDECVTVQKPLHDAWCPVIPITGNHDAAQNNANITGEMLFNAHFKRIANSGFLEGWDSTHTNGYWDSDAHKIRFIFFDDTTRNDYSSVQRSAALSAMVNGTPDEYKIVIFSHHPLSQSLSDSHWQNPVYADEILIPYAGRIICCICGHSHADISETQNGILYIATTLAMYGHDQDGNRGAINTEQETAFDTFVIDQTNKHIYAIRYGHGNNRDWTYTVD